jgi:hypothetical protein
MLISCACVLPSKLILLSLTFSLVPDPSKGVWMLDLKDKDSFSELQTLL